MSKYDSKSIQDWYGTVKLEKAAPSAYIMFYEYEIEALLKLAQDDRHFMLDNLLAYAYGGTDPTTTPIFQGRNGARLEALFKLLKVHIQSAYHKNPEKRKEAEAQKWL